jgi:hypothetical protein
MMPETVAPVRATGFDLLAFDDIESPAGVCEEAAITRWGLVAPPTDTSAGRSRAAAATPMAARRRRQTGRDAGA